jgi:antitoxin HicB
VISSEHTESTLRHYLSLPYRIEVTREVEGEEFWRAQVEELAGCETFGSTPAEAAERVPSAIAEWVAGALSEGREVPEPRSARSYSGRLLLRMPLSLHAELARAAEREQVSLNAYITSQLASAVGWRRAPLPPPSDHGLASPGPQRRGFTWALTVNMIVVAFAAAVALLLLVVALTGF